MKIEYEKIEETLRKIINDRGEAVLLEDSKISSLLKDYFPRMDNERNLLLEVTKIGIWNKLISLKNKKKDLQLSALNECLESILNNTFIKEDIVIKLLEILAGIFGIRSQFNYIKNDLEVPNLKVEEENEIKENTEITPLKEKPDTENATITEVRKLISDLGLIGFNVLSHMDGVLGTTSSNKSNASASEIIQIQANNTPINNGAIIINDNAESTQTSFDDVID